MITAFGGQNELQTLYMYKANTFTEPFASAQKSNQASNHIVFIFWLWLRLQLIQSEEKESHRANSSRMYRRRSLRAGTMTCSRRQG